MSKPSIEEINNTLDISKSMRSSRMQRSLSRFRSISHLGMTPHRKMKIRSKSSHVLFCNYLDDYFTVFAELDWIWIFFIFTAIFSFFWLGFAIFYYMFEDNLSRLSHDKDGKCIPRAHTFLGFFLFSIETQTTIGYGSKYVSNKCVSVTLGVVIQTFIGMILEIILAGVAIYKIRHPKSREHTVIFSEKACICEHDGYRRLMIRIADLQSSEVFSVKVSGYLITNDSRTNTRYLSNYQKPVFFRGECNRPELILTWPTFAIHTIDDKSPFWKMTKDDFQNLEFNLHVFMEAIVGATSCNMQVCTSYTQKDVLWGYQFRYLQFCNRQCMAIDFSYFYEMEYLNIGYESAMEKMTKNEEDIKAQKDEKREAEIFTDDEVKDEDILETGEAVEKVSGVVLKSTMKLSDEELEDRGQLDVDYDMKSQASVSSYTDHPSMYVDINQSLDDISIIDN